MKEETFAAVLAALCQGIERFRRRAGGMARHPDAEGEQPAGLVPRRWIGAACTATSESGLMDLADRLAAGQGGLAEAGPARYLLSPFHRLILDNACPAEEHYLPIAALQVSEDTLFPDEERADAARDCAALWKAFAARATALRDTYDHDSADRASFVSSLLALMQEHTWCLPASSDPSLADISLYDHTRMAAALASCMVGLAPAQIAALQENPGQPLPVACLVGGDLSGVQDFIYTITSRGAAGALRGRSFYLQLLMESIARHILDRLELSSANVIYCGGGGFYLLVPPGAESQIEEMQRYVSRVLLHFHGGDLYLALGSATLHGADFFDGRISTRWREVSSELRTAKARRFSELGADMYDMVFDPGREEGSQERACQVCQREHPDTVEFVDMEDETGRVRKCPLCTSFEELGKNLRNARYLLTESVSPAFDRERPGQSYEDVLRAFGIQAQVSDGVPAGVRSTGRATLQALDDDAMCALEALPNAAIGRRFLVNVTPSVENRIKTSDELAESSQGIKRLGVLRMDVDNLGRLFREGAGKRATLARSATLSFAISLFFEAWVEKLASRHNPPGGEHHVYSIYSGGDDLFIVGSWDRVVQLGQDIRRDFSRYVGQHPGIHLSAGVTLATGKYPLYQAARDAGRAEGASKAHPGKNAVTFLGQTLDWDTFERARDWKERFRKLDQEMGMGRSLLQQLVVLQLQHEKALRVRAEIGSDVTRDGDSQTICGPWIPRAQYVLARFEERYEPAQAELQQLRCLLGKDRFANISWLGLAARWAGLALRRQD